MFYFILFYFSFCILGKHFWGQKCWRWISGILWVFTWAVWKKTLVNSKLGVKICWLSRPKATVDFSRHCVEFSSRSSIILSDHLWLDKYPPRRPRWKFGRVSLTRPSTGTGFSIVVIRQISSSSSPVEVRAGFLDETFYGDRWGKYRWGTDQLWGPLQNPTQMIQIVRLFFIEYIFSEFSCKISNQSDN